MKAEELIELLKENPELPVCFTQPRDSENDYTLVNQGEVLNQYEAWEVELAYETEDNYVDEGGKQLKGKMILLYG